MESNAQSIETHAMLAEINVYPVKSCAGVRLESSVLAPTGLHLDRRWMLVDEDGRYLSQRQEPRMACLKTSILPGVVQVSREDGSTLKLPQKPKTDGETRTVQLHSWTRQARDVGEEPATWFSEAIQRPCRLVEAVPDEDPWRNHEPEGEGATTYFPDLYPLLVASKSTLKAVFPSEEIEMTRFRPNLVLDGQEPFEEDRWHNIAIGQVQIALVKPCTRCSITTVDPHCGVQEGPEPLRTLSKTRSWHGKPVFGWNAIVRAPGPLRAGDPVSWVDQRQKLEPIGP